MKDSRMKLRLAPVVASVAAVTALAVVPATAATASSSASASPTATTTASTTASTATTSPTTTTTAAAAAKPAKAKAVTIGYKCMVLGQYVPVTLTFTVPADLVAASARPVPAGRTLGSVAGGKVPLRTRVTLSKAALARLKLVDQYTIGGKLSQTMWFGSTAIHTVYKTATKAIKPASNGTQSQYVTRDLSTMMLTGTGTATATKGLTAGVNFTTNLMIPGFQWASCTVANKSASRTLLTFQVMPAKISTAVAGAQVTALVRDGANAPGVGTVTETLTGTSHHKKHRSTVKVKLSNGIAVRSWRKTMNGFGLTTGTVSLSFAGRIVNVTLHI